MYFDVGRLYYEDIADASKDTSYKINTEELKLAASTGISVLYHDTALQIVGAGDSLVFSGRECAAAASMWRCSVRTAPAARQ